MNNKDLTLWNKVSTTDPKYIKVVKNGGRTYKAIDAYSQILKGTEVWGSYGDSWGLKNMQLSNQTIGDTTLANLQAKFFYPGGEFEVMNSIKVAYKTNGYKGQEGYLKVDDEALKKLETNTITKALSRLGFNADVFLGQFEDNNYVQEVNYAYADIPNKKLDTEKIREIQLLLKKHNINLASILENYQVRHLGELNNPQYIEIKTKLEGEQ